MKRRWYHNGSNVWLVVGIFAAAVLLGLLLAVLPR